MISNLNGSGSVRVHRKKSGFYRFAVQVRVRFDSLLVSDLLNFEKQKECFASHHMSRDFYYYFLRISSGSNIGTKRFLFRFMYTKYYRFGFGLGSLA